MNNDDGKFQDLGKASVAQDVCADPLGSTLMLEFRFAIVSFDHYII